MHTSFKKALLSATVAVFAAASGHAQATYHVADHWTIGGNGGWDYLLADGPAHRLYVTHATRVEVLDTTTGKVVGAISGMKGTHGIALDSDGKTGYISDGGGNTVVVFDRTNLSTLATIPVGTNPDGIVFDPATHMVWAFNGRSKDVSVVDAASRKVVATIQLPGKPEFPAVDGKGNVYVNIEDKNSIVHLDAKSHTAVATWPLTGCESPSGLTFDVAGHKLFSVCDGGVMAVTDSATGKSLGKAKIGDSPDAAGFDAQKHLAFSSNGGDATLTIVDTNKPGFPVVQTVKTEKGARTMAYDTSTGRVYLAMAKMGAAPTATAANPHPRPVAVPDSFSILVVVP